MKVDMPIYCLHGLLGTCAAHCGRQLEGWREKHRVVVIDLPGHGRSPRDAALPYIGNAVAGLRATIRRHGRGHLLGVSYLGGSIAVRAALAYPDLVADLVLTGFVSDISPDVFLGWIDGFMRLTDTDRSLARHYDAMHGIRWVDTLRIVAAECRDSYYSSFAVSREMIAQLGIPTLILNGDLKSEERLATTTLAMQGPFIEGATISGAGHIPGFERPTEFNLAVEQFWERHNVQYAHAAAHP
jgi:pimeloyl-ACP methyl ester carboxylesterase